MIRKVAIIGAGGNAREILEIFNDCNKINFEYDVLGFIVQARFGNPGEIVNGKPILGDLDWFDDHKEVHGICSVGAPQDRLKLIDFVALKGIKFCSAIHPSVIKSSWIKIGEGVVIAAGTILTTQVNIKDHVQINMHCTIAHDTEINAFSTISPGVCVSGNVMIGEGCFLGTGTSIIQKVKINDWSIIGAGSVIIEDVPANTTVVGVPGRIIKHRVPGWQLQQN